MPNAVQSNMLHRNAYWRLLHTPRAAPLAADDTTLRCPSPHKPECDICSSLGSPIVKAPWALGTNISPPLPRQGNAAHAGHQQQADSGTHIVLGRWAA